MQAGEAGRHLASRTLRPWEPLVATSSAGDARRRSWTILRRQHDKDPWQEHADIAPTFDDSNPMPSNPMPSLRTSAEQSDAELADKRHGQAIRSAELRSSATDTALYNAQLVAQHRVAGSFSSGRNQVVEIDSTAEHGQPRIWSPNTQPRISAGGKKPVKPMPASDFLDSIFGTDGHVEPPEPAEDVEPAEDMERKMAASEIELARLLREIDGVLLCARECV
jgi:hypothetical protein